jgi:CRISPR-associated protein Csy2
MSNVLLINRMRVAAANGHDCTLFHFGPKLTAAFGLLDALTFGHDGTAKNNRLVRFGYIHHHCSPKGEKAFGFSPQQRRGASFINKDDYSKKNPRPGALSLQPTSSMDIEVSLVAVYEDSIDLSHIRSKLNIGRLAGGRIDDYEVSAFGSLDEAFDHVSSGFVLVDRKDLVRPGEEMESLMDVLTMIPNREYDGENPWPAFLSPAVVGYALLSDPRQQAGSVRGQLHAYAEPLIGITQYVSKNKLAQSWESIMWQPSFNSENKMWVLTQADVASADEESFDLGIEIAY